MQRSSVSRSELQRRVKNLGDCKSFLFRLDGPALELAQAIVDAFVTSAAADAERDRIEAKVNCPNCSTLLYALPGTFECGHCGTLLQAPKRGAGAGHQGQLKQGDVETSGEAVGAAGDFVKREQIEKAHPLLLVGGADTSAASLESADRADALYRRRGRE